MGKKAALYLFGIHQVQMYYTYCTQPKPDVLMNKDHGLMKTKDNFLRTLVAAAIESATGKMRVYN